MKMLMVVSWSKHENNMIPTVGAVCKKLFYILQPGGPRAQLLI